MTDNGGIDWKDYFPFVTPDTSGVAERLLDSTEHSRPTDELFFREDEAFNECMMMQLEYIFGFFDDSSSNVSDMNVFM